MVADYFQKPVLLDNASKRVLVPALKPSALVVSENTDAIRYTFRGGQGDGSLLDGGVAVVDPLQLSVEFGLIDDRITPVIVDLVVVGVG